MLESLVSSAILTALLVFLLRAWISERLKQSIGAEYDRKLEVFRSELRSEYEVQIERLRADNARHHALESEARGSLVRLQRSTQERRLDAVVTAWDILLAMRDASSGLTPLLDVLTDQELATIHTIPRVRSDVQSFGGDDASHKVLEAGAGIERLRLLIGDRTFSILFAYRAISARAEFLIARAVEKEHFEPWWKDPAMVQLMRLALNSAEVSALASISPGRFHRLRDRLECLLLEELNRIMTGEAGVKYSVATATAIAEADRRARADT